MTKRILVISRPARGARRADRLRADRLGRGGRQHGQVPRRGRGRRPRVHRRRPRRRPDRRRGHGRDERKPRAVGQGAAVRRPRGRHLPLGLHRRADDPLAPESIVEFFVIGDEEVVLGFRFAGADGTAVYNRAGALEAFQRATTAGDVKILILTEQVSAMIEAEVTAWQFGGCLPPRGRGARHRGSPREPAQPGGRHPRGRGSSRVMEVLNTGEELGRQILEDARKKASRLLEAGRPECSQSARRAGEPPTPRARASPPTATGARPPCAPRWRRRCRSTSCARASPSSRTRSSRRCGRSSRDSPRTTSRRSSSVACDGLAPRSRAARLPCARAGLDEARVRALLARAVPGVGIDGVQTLDAGRGVEIESTDGRVRFRCTTDELESEMLEDRREELAVAVLGREVLEAGT